MSKKYRDKFIDLKVNGRLFPSWMLANFRQYKLPDIIKSDKTDEDPCISKSKLELRKYQLFLSKYLDFNSPYKNLLIYHGLGSGKTASTINIYNMLYNYTPGWNVFILLKATLKDHPWIPDLNKWLQEDEKKFRFANIIFISYDSPIADKTFLDEIKKADSSKKSLFVIEEAHNFIRNVYSNISSKKGRRAQTIYDYIIQDQKENDGTRVICLSATPAINTPYEIALLFNLLRPNLFTKSETQFNQEFISSSTFQTINPAKKNLFQRRILGLVSYYIGATPEFYPSKRINYIDVEMSEYQNEIYTYFENIEEQQARKKKAKTASSETYKSYTRQSCNFVFPLMSQGKSGETRPRPKAFAVSEKEGQLLQKAKSVGDKDKESYYNVQKYLDAIEDFINLFDKHLSEIEKEDHASGNTLEKDVETYKKKYKSEYMDFLASNGAKSKLFKELHKCSAKFVNIIFNILCSEGPVLFYSNYVLMEGIQIFKIYLKYFGFSGLEDYLSGKNTGKDGFRYIEYHGMIDKVQRSENLVKFNELENKHGAICKLIMISPAGAEGLTLKRVRQVHLAEPYWHEVRMSQMIGRAVRMCSHEFLPKDEWNVEVFRYKSIRAGGGKMTTDQYIEDLARSKEGLIQSFLDAIKEAAIDCVLNMPHNSLVQDYKCFQFDEQSLFDEQVGPAYKDDIVDDSRIDNGMNSTKSRITRIKVLKIKAVKQLSDGTENIKYSKPEYYWYNQDSKVVYDYELYFAIGKVGIEDDLPKKLDKDTYIIDRLIPIPMIESI